MEKPPSPFWHSLLYGRKAGLERAERDETYVANVYSLLAVVAAGVFGGLHITEGNPVVGSIELACSLVFLINMIVFHATGRLQLARSVLLASIMGLMIVLLLSGGTRGTGIYWLFIFPLATFFLVGKQQGLWWMATLYLAVMLIGIGSYFDLVHTPYSLVALRQLLISLGVVVFGVYVYQGAREAALKDVQDSRRDLQEYLDQMTTYSIKVGMDGRILFANKVAKESSGLGERLLGTKFLDGKAWATNEAARGRTEAAFYDALTGKHVSYDEQIKAASTVGYQLLTVNFSLVPISKDGRIEYVLVEARDVTAERDADRTKSEFVSLASSQLQPSLSAIAWTAESLNAAAASLPADQHQNIQRIYHHSQLIRSAIDRMLLVSNLELKNLPIKPTMTHVDTLAHGVVAELRTQSLTGSNLEIGEDYAENTPALMIDPGVMQTILRNLISNAIKFTPNAGHINIRISTTDHKLTPASQGSLHIEVQDSGKGIPTADQKLLFTKFFRAANADDTDSAGLGLYIVKKLLDYVGGTITFTSKESVGSIFVVTLPLEGMLPHTAQ
jgi:signal transduction histidine kinase